MSFRKGKVMHRILELVVSGYPVLHSGLTGWIMDDNSGIFEAAAMELNSVLQMGTLNLAILAHREKVRLVSNYRNLCKRPNGCATGKKVILLI